ncbi:MAG: hypothetical protein ACI95C_002781 [Pseudohongiellaceae bacterium]|jgi:hypothetical protein
MSDYIEASASADLGALANSDDNVEHRTIVSRMKVRDKVAEDIAAYLQNGGTIIEVAPNVTADPPRKPESNYGARSI